MNACVSEGSGMDDAIVKGRMRGVRDVALPGAGHPSSEDAWTTSIPSFPPSFPFLSLPTFRSMLWLAVTMSVEVGGFIRLVLLQSVLDNCSCLTLLLLSRVLRT